MPNKTKPSSIAARVSLMLLLTLALLASAFTALAGLAPSSSQLYLPLLPRGFSGLTLTPTFTGEPGLTRTATASATATHTATLTRTPTPSATGSPTPTRTLTPTHTQTASATLTRTVTPSPTYTPTRTHTMTPTPTQTATRTPTPTRTRTITPSATGSTTPTVTPSPTRTATPTLTYTPTRTATSTVTPTITTTPSATPTEQYLIIGWNDLGMHCYDNEYSTLTVLPPYNNLWAQVIRRGDPPQLVTSGVTVEYSFPGNSESASKTNFWVYVEKIFGVALPPNIGLAGKGMVGSMDLQGDHFVALGIPVTEYSDSAPTIPDYFQVALLQVKDTQGRLLAQSQVVAPISSEMRCDVCHTGPTPNFRMNILLKHDEEESTHLADLPPVGQPVLCAECHADPALGQPGKPGVPSLSAAMHGKHKELATNCYNCHPGPLTQCLRDVMSTQYGLTCTDCHVGGMEALGQEDRTPWVDEPRCADCHDANYAENPGTLYRNSLGHGGMYCESCHNSTHAILPSRETNDNLQVIALQGYADTLQECTVCHLTQPGAGGPHH